MTHPIRIFLYTCIAVVVLAVAANGQTGPKTASNGGSSPAVQVLKGTGKAAVIIVGSAAKVTWKTTKFTAKHVVKPAAKYVLKPIVVKAAPKVGMFLLKTTGQGAKILLPIAVRLSVL